MDQTALDKLKGELPKVFPIVVAYAVKLCRTKPWFNGSAATISDVARELALDAVDRTMRDKRPWDSETVPLADHLQRVVDSLASNRATAAEMRAARLGEEDASTTEQSADASVARPTTGEDFYLSKEACEAIEEDAYEAAGGDPTLTEFVEAVTDGPPDVSVAEICKARGLTAAEVYAAKKKLKARRKTITRRYQP